MAKGGKKRRAIRKKKEKGLQVQTSGSAGKDESHTCQQLEEDSCSPKTPIQTSEGDEKEGGSPTSQAEGFAFSQGIEHTNGSLGNLGFHNFSDSQTEGIGNLDVSVRTYERHGTLQPPQEQEEHGKDAFLDWSVADVVKTRNQSKDGFGVKNGNTLEGNHFDDGSIQNLGFYGLDRSQTDEFTQSEGLEIEPTKFKSTINFNEGFSMSSSEVPVTFLDSSFKLESAMQDGDGDCQLSKKQNEHRKDAVEISEDFQLLLEQDGPKKYTILDSSESKHVERLQNANNFGPNNVTPSEGLESKPKERLPISEISRGACVTSKGVCINSFQASLNSKNVEKLESAMPGWHEGSRLVEEQYRHRKDVSLDISGPIVEGSNQSKDETMENVKNGGTLTDMPRENPTLEGLVVPLPATEPTADAATPMIPADLGSKESSHLRIQDTQDVLKEKDEKEKDRNPRAISEEHTQQTDLAKLNGEGEAINLKSTLPEEPKIGHKENDIVLQRREKLQNSWLSFCGMLEFFFGSRN